MATDEREWTLIHRLGWEHWTVRGPSTCAEIVVPKSRAVAAEHRVRKLQEEIAGLRITLAAALGREKRLEQCLLGERDPENPGSLAFQVHDAAAKLATAVEVLRDVHTWSLQQQGAAWIRNRVTQALPEIEQGKE